ncbi:MAG: hypothetical protein ACKVE4_11705 [Dissulfuribacterales bacterium]
MSTEMDKIDKNITDLDSIDLAYWLMKRDRQEITKNLRERKRPLSVKYCKKIADLIDPDKLQPQGRPPLIKRQGEVAYATKQWPKNITKMQFIRVDALARSLIGYPKYGIANAEKAKEATCKTLGISDRTYCKIYKQCKGHWQYDREKQLTAELIKEQNPD